MAPKNELLNMKTHQTIIKASSGWRPINLKELKGYKDLLFFLVIRDIKVIYKQTALGFSWAILKPIFSMVVFSIIFGRLAKIPSDGVPYPIFAFAAIVPWSYFSASMIKSTRSLLANSGLLTKIYFPRIIFPITPVIASLVDFIIALAILAALMVYFGIYPTVYVFFLPYLLLLMILTASGIGMWFSALAIQYRDVRQAVGFVTRLLMYASPVIWPVSLIPDEFRVFYGLYPMAGVIEGFRCALLGTRPMPWDLICSGTPTAILIAISGAYYFRRMERYFADVA